MNFEDSRDDGVDASRTRTSRRLALGISFWVLLILCLTSTSGASARVVTQGHGCRLNEPQSAAHWLPAPTTAPWQLQLHGEPDLRIKACVFDLDGFETSKRTVSTLHRRHVRVICNIDVGAWESDRPDAQRFPRQVIGRAYKGHTDQRWLDISDFSRFAGPLIGRIAMCARKGFDAVEPDNVDGWERRNRTGFSITRADQVRFNRWLAWQVHIRGMAIGLKNDGRQAQRLYNNFDFAIVEQCFRRHDCSDYQDTFVRHDKAVFDVELGMKPRFYCEKARDLRFSAIGKDPQLLPSPWIPCR